MMIEFILKLARHYHLLRRRKVAARKRKEGESFKDYRFNLKNEAFADKVKAKPKMIWDSSKHGTFVK